jgi:UDP-2,4-diacetamido-2,4,6-trideoxy-beta-L-altropyranose hydrolase
MRCLVLADALKSKGAFCSFVCREHPGNLEALIKRRGYSVNLLPMRQRNASPVDSISDLAHADWLGADLRSDAEQTAECITDFLDYIIIDHYAIDIRWESALRKYCRQIMVIDDLADRAHDCDLLLDQNYLPNADRYAALIPGSATALIGPRYALLRNDFALASTPSKNTTSPRLLIMFGGADRSRQTERMLHMLAEMAWQDPVDVVAGPLYPDMPALREAAAILPAAKLHVAPTNIATLMHRADIGLGASGVTGLERCACGLPSITVAQAKNQEAIGTALAETGAHWYLGHEANVTDSEWRDALRMLVKQTSIRQHMSVAAAAICDGQGLRRVVAHLMHVAMGVRTATDSDGDLLFSWRNDERTRRLSGNPGPLDYEMHLHWITKTLDDPNVDMLILGTGGRDMACVRFDCEGETATVSIYVDPNLQGQGVGRGALAAAINWLKLRRTALKYINAVVMKSNHASHQLFISSGFKPSQTNYDLHL